MKKIIILISMIFIFLSCSKQEEIIVEKNEAINKIQIQTSIIPLASLTNYIGWDFVEAKSIVPAWVSPHGYDLKPEQMVEIAKSDLIIYLNLDHIDGFLNKALEKKETLVVSEWIKLVEWTEHSHEEEEYHEDEHLEDEKHTDEEKNHSVDPHIWTSSSNALIMAEKIKDKLSEISPENKEYFENNLNSLKTELESAKNDFLNIVKDKNQSEFIIFHDAYNYLFIDLNIDSSKRIVFQKSVLSDPNSSEMKELIDEIKLHWVKVAYKEPQLNDSNLKKLSIDYNLEVFVLNPLGSDSSKNGYIENFKNNLKSLEKIYE